MLLTCCCGAQGLGRLGFYISGGVEIFNLVISFSVVKVIAS